MKRQTRGNYYAYTLELTNRRNRVVTIEKEVGRQLPSAKAARALVEATGLRGYVDYWSEETQSRKCVAMRDTDGTWWTTDPFTGERVNL